MEPDYFKLAREGGLPADFDEWGLANNRGWTVAHEAAKHGHLPEDFNQWDLGKAQGHTTVAEVAELFAEAKK